METYTQDQKQRLLKRFTAIALVLVFAVSAADFYSALFILFPYGTNTPIIEPVLGIFFGTIYGVLVVNLPPIVSLGVFGRIVFCFVLGLLAHFSPYWANWYELSHYTVPEELREHVFSHENSWWGYGDSRIYYQYCTKEDRVAEVDKIGGLLFELGWSEVWRYAEGGWSDFVEGSPSDSYSDSTYLAVSTSEVYWNCPEAEHRVSVSLFLKPTYSDRILYYSSLAGAVVFLAYGALANIARKLRQP